MTYDDVLAAESELEKARIKDVETKVAYLKANGVEAKINHETGKAAWQVGGSRSIDSVHAAVERFRSNLDISTWIKNSEAYRQINAKTTLFAIAKNDVPANGKGEGIVVVNGKPSEVCVNFTNPWKDVDIPQDVQCCLQPYNDGYIVISSVVE